MVTSRRRARFAALALLCAGACTSSHGSTHRSSTTTVNPFPVVSLQVSGDAPPAVLEGVRKALDDYVARAVVTALKTGTAADLTPVFSADALAGAMGADRASLTDEGLAGVTSLRPSTATVVVAALGDQVASAQIDLTVVALVGVTPVTIHRTGDIALVADGGLWHIDAYDVKVTRDTPATPPPPATPTSTTATGTP